MPEGLRLVVSADVTQAEQNLKRFADRAGREGQRAGSSLTAGLSKAAPALNAIFRNLLGGGIITAGIAGVVKLGQAVFSAGNAFNAAAFDAAVFAKATKNIADDTARLSALVAVAKDVSLSTHQRTNAIAELQKQYPGYLRNISLETINSDGAKKAIDDLTKSILNKALVQEFSTRAAAEIIKKDELHQKVLNREAQTLSNINQLQKLRAQGAPSDAIKKFSGIVEEANARLREETNEFNKQAAVVKTLEDRLKGLTATSLDFINTPKIKDPKQLKEKIEKIIDRQIPFIRYSPVIIIDPNTAAPAEDTTADKIRSRLERQIQEMTERNPILFRSKVNLELTADNADVQKSIANINATIQAAAADAFAGIGQGLGEVLAGGDLKNAFKNFAGIIGSGFQAIGKQMIAAAPVIQALKTALKTTLNPAILLPAGVALVAIGAALKQAISGGIGGFKEGGFTGFGSPNEIAGVVHKGEFVIPANILKKMRGNNVSMPNLAGLLGESKIRVEIAGRLDGNDILLSNARTYKKNKRVGGSNFKPD